MKQLAFIAVLSILTFTSCSKHQIKGEGDVVSETRYPADFDAIQASGDLDVVVYPSDKNMVIVSGYQNLVPIFETSVNGKTLRLRYKDDYYNVRNNNIRVEVYTTSLSSYSLNGSGRVVMKPGFTSSRMDLNISGSGDIDMEENRFTDMDCSISGSGNISARSCETDNAWVRISGSGNVSLTVQNSLDVEISGSGDVDYWGNGTVTRSKISGSGEIKKH